jgi:hypothetical protein
MQSATERQVAHRRESAGNWLAVASRPDSTCSSQRMNQKSTPRHASGANERPKPASNPRHALSGPTRGALDVRGVDTKVGQSSKDDPREVAKQGFEAMMRGDGEIISGWQKGFAPRSRR